MPVSASQATAGVHEVTLGVGDVELSGLLHEAADPRGLIVAVHGGGARAGYFHGPVHPDLSLLTLAGALGYSVFAPDRPGHGASAGSIAGWPIERKTDLMVEAIAQLGPIAGCRRPVVIGHSFGAQLSMHLAARAGFAAGVALFGSGTDLREDVMTRPAAAPGRIWDLVWGPSELYFDGARAAMPTSAPAPGEQAEMQGWPDAFAGVAAGIAVPVQLAHGEHEALWRIDEAALAQLAARFVAAPLVRTLVLSGAPHNVSISRAARAYHLAVLAFAEECIARDGERQSGPPLAETT